MQIVFADSETDFYEKAAFRIAEEIRKNPTAQIGLSTGRTTRGVHAALVRMHREHPFDCTGVRVFGIDEIANMSRECKASCYYILLHEVVEPLGIPLENFRMPDPMAEDLQEQCRLFEESVMSKGGPDFIFLGLGENGHLGFNQPGTPFGQGTWLSFMDASLDERLRRENNIPKDVKMGGLTLGIRNLMHSKKLVMAANGRNKTEIAAKLVSGPVTEEVPASILQLHPCCEVILDPEAAGSLIKEKGSGRAENDIYERLRQMGEQLPAPPARGGVYQPVVRVGNLLYVSGQGATREGVVAVAGHVGGEVTCEEGRKAARICALNALSCLENFTGDLNKVKRLVKTLGFVQSAEGFHDQPAVINGASEFLRELFGEELGVGARSAVSCNELPGNTSVEIEFVFELK